MKTSLYAHTYSYIVVNIIRTSLYIEIIIKANFSTMELRLIGGINMDFDYLHRHDTHQVLLSCYEVTEELLKQLTFIAYNDKNIYLGKEQIWKLSPSGKTIYIVQQDNGKEVGRKGFRTSSCLFFSEYYD